MATLIDSGVFLLGAYWPFVLGAALVGVATGWLSLGRKPGEGAQ